ncbi:MAG: hypothetical protein GXN93_03155 [Candidatus Diapherotrites archaeon]|nr:hypothetical protein [Candidatus Diapherotrites archaeon]
MFENLFGGGNSKKATGPAAANKPAIQPAISFGAPAVQPPAAGQAAAGGKDLNVIVEDLQKDVEKLKDSVNAIRGTLKNITEKMEALEQNMSQLASVYELLTNQTNPFLDEDERKAVPSAPKQSAPSTAPVAIPTMPEEPKRDVVLPEIDQTNPKVIQNVIDWMEFLVERVGHSGIESVLQYYVDIHWISEEVADILKRYADGIRVDNEPAAEEAVQLDPEDHMKSLDYILQIKDLQQG